MSEVKEEKKDAVSRFIGFLDDRIGFSKTFLRPPPVHTLNPFAWLGALAVLAFFAQGITGVLMMLYYVPTPDSAYQSTTNVIQKIPMGSLLETFHLYMAYAMILIVFMHLMRNYFASVGKKPRELMWVVGFVMGVLTLGQALTGYLLPWSVLSKSATDVFIGTLGVLPPQLFLPVKYLLTGTGSDAQELFHFFVFHTVVIPFTLFILIILKIYMYEIHGHAPPASGLKEGQEKAVPFFWDATWYMLMIGAAFVAVVIVVSSVFPLSLPPEYSPQAAAQAVVQPDWYFLWLYQVLKFQFFAGPNEPLAIGIITVFFIVLAIIPFIDRKKERDPMKRPWYVTLGGIMVAEIVVLTVWGYLTPGQNAPTGQVIEIMAGTALLVIFVFWLAYRWKAMTSRRLTAAEIVSSVKFLKQPFENRGPTFLFLLLLAIASYAMASTVSAITVPGYSLGYLLGNTLLLGISLYAMSKLLKYLVQNYEMQVKRK
ncbi:MAG: cytochrome bc complex cytochrome b subunit [Conexivisphaerales archaeon]